MAIEEYRFEVRLNWDRMLYYAVVSSGVIAVAAGLIKDAKSPAVLVLCGTLFVLGAILSVIGIIAIHKGRDYYQATIFKKTLYEEVLGLNEVVSGQTNPEATLAIATTQGMQEAAAILKGRPPKALLKRLFRHRVVSYFMWFLMILAVIDAVGAVYAFSQVSTGTVPQPTSITVTLGDGRVLADSAGSDEAEKSAAAAEPAPVVPSNTPEPAGPAGTAPPAPEAPPAKDR